MKGPFAKRKQNSTVPLGTIPRRRLQAPVDDTKERRVSRDDNLGANVMLRESIMNSDVGASKRLEVHKLKDKRRRLSYMVIGLLAAFVAIFLLLTQSTFVARASLYGQVGEIDQSRIGTLDSAIADFFNDNPLQRIHFIFSDQVLVDYLQGHNHSEIESLVSTTRTSLGNVRMVFKAREPVASWSSGSTNRFVDASGVVFSENYYTRPSIAIIDQSGLSDNRDLSVVASSRLLRFIGLASSTLRADRHIVKQIVLPANTTRQINMVLDNGLTLKMTVDRPVGEQCEDANRALAYFAKHKIKVKYVDVRVSRNAFYK